MDVYFKRKFGKKNFFSFKKLIMADDKRIYDKNIPTHGYILQAIDYGMVLHAKYDLDKVEYDQLIHDNDLYQNVYKIIFKIMLKNLVDIDINQIVPISKKHKKKIKKIIYKYKSNKDTYIYFEELLYKILYFNKFQEQICIDDKVELFDFLSIKDVKYIFTHYDNLGKILIYLIKKY